MPKDPVKLTDTTLRDGHQSLMATRLRTADMEPIVPELDSVGYFSLEVWGGATFDSATRFLAEDPWERLRKIKALAPNTPLMMLLRGQNLVGYRTYPDDVVEAFVLQSAKAGVDIFRVFDALNDEWNLETAARAVKRAGKHLQLTICYSVTEEGHLGGPIYNLEYYLQKARLFQEMGADSICIKDMAGLLAPYDAYLLITELKKAVDLPIQLHTHYTSGMGSMTALKAIEAGVDVVDTALAPLALRTSQPAVEPLVVTLQGHERDPGLNLAKLIKLGDYLESVLPKYRRYLEAPRIAVIDARVLSHQIPGGMVSNLVSQLREAGALERLNEVLEEIPRTRKELGYPPLVTPLSQMVGTQAVMNVLFGRYKMVSDQVKDYVYGLYGRSPAPMDPEVVKVVLKDYERGQEPISQRPAELLEPELEKAREAVKGISTDMEDVLTYALYPTTGMKFLRIKHGLEPRPAEEEAPEKPKAVQVTAEAPKSKEAPPRSPRARTFNVFVDGRYFQVEVDPVAPGRGATPQTAQAAPSGQAAPEPAASPPREAPAAEQGVAIKAPMPGILLRYEVKVGQKVKAGDPVVVIEAMKMENSLPSPVDGQVTALPCRPGATVSRDEVLAVITPGG